MNFAIYMIGAVLVAAGFGYAAYAIGLSGTWIIIIALVILGFGIMGAVKKTQKKE